MKPGIHPEYMPSRITCACGRVTETFATREEIHVEICSHCHPFYTGRQKLVDTAGRVERFRRKYGSDTDDSGADADDGDANDGDAGSGGDEADAAAEGSDAPTARGEGEPEAEAEPEAEGEPVGAAEGADGAADED